MFVTIFTEYVKVLGDAFSSWERVSFVRDETTNEYSLVSAADYGRSMGDPWQYEYKSSRAAIAQGMNRVRNDGRRTRLDIVSMSSDLVTGHGRDLPSFILANLAAKAEPSKTHPQSTESRVQDALAILTQSVWAEF